MGETEHLSALIGDIYDVSLDPKPQNPHQENRSGFFESV
jgi:hypothetical protein